MTPPLEFAPEFIDDPIDAEPIRQLREYQDTCIEKTLIEFETRRSTLVVVCTGGGKTVIAGHLSNRFLGRGQKVLMVAHTDELIEQARDKFARVLGRPVAKEKAEDYATLFDDVVIGSVQTLRGDRLRSWPPDHFGLIIVDEAHRSHAATHSGIINHFTGAKVLGITATPVRGDRKALSEIFESIAFDYGIFKAVRDGWLVRPVVKTMPLQIDLRGVETRGGDLASDEVEHRIEPYLVEIARLMREHVPDKTSMVFLPTVHSAELMAQHLRSQRFIAESVSGYDADRFERIERFRNRETQVVCNAMLLTEGFDNPQVDCIVCLRPTKLLGLFTQVVGRASRPLDEIVPALNAANDAAERRAIIAASRKPHFLILDFLYLYETHGKGLIKPAHLVAPNEQVAERMARDGDLLENEEAAERDLEASLAKQLAAAGKKKRAPRTIDPFAAALAGHAEDALSYEPMGDWEKLPLTDGQKKELTRNRIDLAKVRDRGHAKKILDWIFERRRKRLCAPRALMFLKSQGIDASEMNDTDAKKIIQAKLAGWKSRSDKQTAFGFANRL